ncbi:chitinase [Mesoplasma entomophilum]|uniref:Bifunctional chitinase/lysozyme n=1 Tax=Mesoplasma entomophilum TaxID=2149 RepID=A0A3S5XZ82_9MOLU|nr:lipoprotein [Mesoplasma entomophilum]ATQ35475.1 hypothetical protein CS528_01700 [Mesoplasma entomophilum]ATZ19435.1 chitinase [Mesoplasma entomophilum]
MKKLLSLLAAVTLTATSASAVISCGTGKPGKINLIDLSTIELDIKLLNKITENDILNSLKRIEGLENIELNIDVTIKIEPSDQTKEGLIIIKSVKGSKYIKNDSSKVIIIEKIREELDLGEVDNNNDETIISAFKSKVSNLDGDNLKILNKTSTLAIILDKKTKIEYKVLFIIKNESKLGESKTKSVKNQDWQKVLKTDYSNSVKNYSSYSLLDNDQSTLGSKNVINNHLSKNLQFTPYADMGIVEDTSEYLLKNKGVSQASRNIAMESLKDTNAVYNDLGELAGNKNIFTQDTEITLGFMQNASDTGELVPMWNAAPSNGGNGILDDKGSETEYAKWFNDRYRNWTSKSNANQSRWEGNKKTGNLNPKDVRISFGPFANSFWHTAWQNNKTPEELASVFEKIGEKYQTKKLDFYFAAPYLSASGQYADSQRLLASALKILIERDSAWDIQLSLVTSSKDGVSINSGFFSNNPNEKGNLKLIGDEAFPLYNFTKYLGMNFKLNMVYGYSEKQINDDENWELKLIQEASVKTRDNWIKLNNVLNPSAEITANSTWGNDGSGVVNGISAEDKKSVSKRMKITPWIGRRAEVPNWSFTTKDAENLRKFASEENFGAVGMFYLSRDIPSEYKPNHNNTGDLNALDQNIRSGMGFSKYSFAGALNGTKEDIKEEDTNDIEEIIKRGGIDYDKQIRNNNALDQVNQQPGQGWDGPSIGGENGGSGAGGSESGGNIVSPPPTGKGKSAYKTWDEANPNRNGKKIKDKHKANKTTYFSPYLDAGLYEGNNISEMKHLDHLTLAFVQQVNEHSNHLELSIAGQAKNNASYQWWEETQLWGKMLKPISDAGNFKNIKVAYGGATTGGYTEKNPWTLANKLHQNNSQQAQEDLRKALINYQKELVKIAEKYGNKKYEMPKSIDFDIEGNAQNLGNDNILLAKTLAKMKKADPAWNFSVTLPVLPSGLTSVGYNVMNIFVKEYKAAGLSISDLPVINLMLMDYGDPIYLSALADRKTNFDLAKDAIDNTVINLKRSILENFKESVNENQLYSLIGVTPMIGVNDTVEGVFTDEDAKELYNWAQEKKLAYLSMWSMNDDRGKSLDGKEINKSLLTHGLWYLNQYDFSKIFVGDWSSIQK